jgi:hypothetical protein
MIYIPACKGDSKSAGLLILYGVHVVNIWISALGVSIALKSCEDILYI